MNSLQKTLHKKGYRLTNQRQKILSALTSTPQSVEEVMASLRKTTTKIDRVTVYRSLDRFVDLGVVGKTQFKDKTAKYELLTDKKHHHHLVCDKCGFIEDIAIDESILLRSVSKKTSFLVKSHCLEFFGLCTDCK